MRDIRLSLAGCGRIAWAHLYGWSTVQGATIVGLADTKPDAVRALAAEYSVGEDRIFTDYRKMLASSRADVVIVSTWHGHHHEAVIAAARQRPRVIICEKPLSTSLGSVEEMILACDQNGVRLVVGHQRRFYPAWIAARQAIADGLIGNVVSVYSRSRDGLLNNGSHNVDLVRFLLGDPAARTVTGTVERRTDRYERGCRAEDSALGLVIFEGGTRLTLEADIDRSLPISANALLTGTNGLLRVRENRIDCMTEATGGWRPLCPSPEGSPDDSTDESDGRLSAVHRLVPFFEPEARDQFAGTFISLARSVADFAASSAKPPAGEMESARATIEIIMAIYESARLRQTVSLPLVTRDNPLDLMVDSGELPVAFPGRYDIRADFTRA